MGAIAPRHRRGHAPVGRDQRLLAIRQENRRLRGEHAGLRREVAALKAEVERLRGENARLRERFDALQSRVQDLRRSAKRQAAPFSRGERKRNPAPGGRRAGAQYGRRARREAPERVDEEIFVPLPHCCPDCGQGIAFAGTLEQYQEDIPPPQTIVRRFDIAYGHCRGCGRRVQGRDHRQTSDAVGACASQVGPQAVALASCLNKELGIPVGKVCRLLQGCFRLAITPGGLRQALHRQARKAAPTYQALIEGVRSSAVVSPDETGWRVGGEGAWLWAFAGEGVTVYLIASGRGFDEAAAVLGCDYAGVLERDGWAVYRRFSCALHQTCHAHLLRRCGELIADSLAGQARVPHAVRRLLADALALRDAREQEALGTTELDARVQVLEERTDALLAMRPTHQPNRRLLDHLRAEREHLYTFLYLTGVQATNWRAEQAIRPAVVNRKQWGGNKSARGAETQQVLMSVIRSARQQGRDPAEPVNPNETLLLGN
jgi:transposase